jgi:hypothetical protein
MGTNVNALATTKATVLGNLGPAIMHVNGFDRALAQAFIAVQAGPGASVNRGYVFHLDLTRAAAGAMVALKL